MSKLKTLKDINSVNNQYGEKAFYEEELKQEAINWIKEDIQNHYNLFRDVLNGREIKSPTMNLIVKWMKRFDITNEDLKNG